MTGFGVVLTRTSFGFPVPDDDKLLIPVTVFLDQLNVVPAVALAGV